MTFFTREQEISLQHLFRREDHYEDYGFSVMAEADGFDIFIWEAIYIIQGGMHRPASQWLGDGAVNNSMVVIAPSGWRHTGMHDNDYFRTGFGIPQYFRHEDLKVTEEDGNVVWRVGEMTYVSELATGTHYVKGRNGSVELDLKFVQLPGTSVVPLFGEGEQAIAHGAAGAYSYSDCSGTLKIGGRTYEIRRGDGLHEHIAHSQCPDWDVAVVGPKRDKKGGAVFGSWRAGDHAFQIHSETPDNSTVVVASRGSSVIFHGDEVDLVTTDHWVDPKSGVSVPCAWKVACRSVAGTLEVELKGHARGAWPWELKRGVMFETLVMATTNGLYRAADGSEVRIADSLAIMDYCRMLYVHHETLEGADLTPTW